MGTNPGESTVLRSLAVSVGAAGCAMLCLRTVRLLGVALAFALKKRGDDANIREKPLLDNQTRPPENTK